jgi:hypothetical protein
MRPAATPMGTNTSRLVQAAGALGSAAGAFVLLSRGDLAVDTGIGRRYRALGPMRVRIAAPPATVFDVVAEPYLHRTPHAMQDKLEVWERGADMALAAHRTRTRWFTTTTVEAVRFERPHLITFRLARGPVPHVAEVFELRVARNWPAGGRGQSQAGSEGASRAYPARIPRSPAVTVRPAPRASCAQSRSGAASLAASAPAARTGSTIRRDRTTGVAFARRGRARQRFGTRLTRTGRRGSTRCASRPADGSPLG